MNSVIQEIISEQGYLRVGTDCSGIEAPIQALNQLKIPIKHVFSCDIDKYCRESIEANYDPEILFEDMRQRKVKDIPDIDLYVCGFPCQSFSVAGKREGTEDQRGTIFWKCLEVIKKKLPKIFVLENVKGLLSIDNGNTFKEIISSLKGIKKNKNLIYNVDWKVLNTKDYGIPQSRDRVFIVGISKEYDFDFEWPKKKKMKSLESYVDYTDDKKDNVSSFVIKKKLFERIPKKSIFIDLSFTNASYPNSDIICPCLTTRDGLWCVPLKRKANIKEILSLQGFPKNFKQAVSDAQMKKQIGNSMSVNVLKEIFKNDG